MLVTQASDILRLAVLQSVHPHAALSLRLKDPACQLAVAPENDFMRAHFHLDMELPRERKKLFVLVMAIEHLSPEPILLFVMCVSTDDPLRFREYQRVACLLCMNAQSLQQYGFSAAHFSGLAQSGMQNFLCRSCGHFSPICCHPHLK